MNTRERMVALVVVLAVVLLVGSYVFHRLVIVPLDEKDASIQRLEEEIQKKRDRIQQVVSDMPRLERARQLSLPPKIDLARREYAKYLYELMRDSGFADGKFTVLPPKDIDAKTAPSIANKGAVYQKLDFQIHANTTLGNLVTMLDGFYRTGLLHQVKKLSILRPMTQGQQQDPNELDINMTIEALIVSGVHERDTLKPGPSQRLVMADAVTAMHGAPAWLASVVWAAGPAGPPGPRLLARTERDYKAIAEKNIFLGPVATERMAEEVEVTEFVHLTDISQGPRRSEAWLYNRLTNKRTRLRAERGFDRFVVVDEKGDTRCQGTVIRMDDRDVIFKVKDNYYSIHVGQTLEDALKKPLTGEQRRTLGLVMADDKNSSSGP